MKKQKRPLVRASSVTSAAEKQPAVKLSQQNRTLSRVRIELTNCADTLDYRSRRYRQLAALAERDPSLITAQNLLIEAVERAGDDNLSAVKLAELLAELCLDAKGDCHE